MWSRTRSAAEENRNCCRAIPAACMPSASSRQATGDRPKAARKPHLLSDMPCENSCGLFLGDESTFMAVDDSTSEQATKIMGHVKLHIPGPVEGSEKTFRAFCSPMIGHRVEDFK